MEEAELDGCSNEALADAIGQLFALICASEAQLFALLRRFAGRQAFLEDGCRDLCSWLVARLSLSGQTARAFADTALALGSLPALSARLAAGEICLDQLAPLARIATPDSDAALADEVLGLSAAGAEALARRSRAVPPEDERDAHRRRHFSLSPSGGATRLRGLLPALEGEQLRVALERIMQQTGPDEGGVYDTPAVRRADALVTLAGLRIAEDRDPERASVVVHVDDDVLAGGPGPAETGSGIALTAETARRAACDARLRILRRDIASGRLDLGRATRTIPPPLARYLRHRDGGCRFPSCGSRYGVQGHHIVYWGRNGRTDRTNLVALCGRCHRKVHEGGWRIEGDAEATLAFVSPSGRRIENKRAPLRDEVARRFGFGTPVPAGAGDTGAGEGARAGPDPPAPATP
jgi:hypothetical protein